MIYVVIGLLVVLIVLVIICIFRIKGVNEVNLMERLGKIEKSLTREIGDFKLDFSRVLTKDFETLNDRIDNRLNNINNKVQERLDVNFEKTNKTFNNVIERLAKIDEAQKKIDNLSHDIVSLEQVLTDKKSRGIFGEVNLYHILSSIFGEKNDKIYRTQHTFSNGSIVDAVLFAPKPLGVVGIDSKFPLENYRNMLEKGITEEEKKRRNQNMHRNE